MAADPGPGDDLRRLGATLPFRDGAEATIVDVLRAAGDRSSTSDELATAIRDWPTRYHFARERSQLLRPLRIPEGARVVDVGAGTGTISRYLGEQGAHVLAVEGAAERAEAIRARCRDLEGVEVVVGALDDVPGDAAFDLAVVVGALEYSGSDLGGAGGPERFLATVRRLVRPGGALVLAIENQLGLKYLSGWPEDHHGRPWIGLAGYPGASGIRTWSRRRLARLLEVAGFGAQRWLYPFADYKLPTAVLAHDLYQRDDAARLVDQLVRTPVVDHSTQPPHLFDERAFHRQLLDAGLGPDVANSFLVVAADAPGALDGLLEPGVLAHLYDGERLRRWRREKRLVVGERAPELAVEARRIAPDTEARAGWLSQQTEARAPWIAGPTVEREVLDRLAVGDVDGARAELVRWREHLRAFEEPGVAGAANPFAPTGATRLPPDLLDAEPANFVVSGDRLHHVDREWAAAGGVDADLVALRALRFFSERLVLTGAAHPWSGDPRATVDEVCRRLGEWCGVPADAPSLARWRHAEAEFQSLVRGVDRDGVARDLAARGGAVRPGSEAAEPAGPDAEGSPPSPLRRVLGRLRSAARR